MTRPSDRWVVAHWNAGAPIVDLAAALGIGTGSLKKTVQRAADRLGVKLSRPRAPRNGDPAAVIRPGWGSTGRFTCHTQTGRIPGHADTERTFHEDQLSITVFGSFAMVGHLGSYMARMSPGDLIDFGTELAVLGRALMAAQHAEALQDGGDR